MKLIPTKYQELETIYQLIQKDNSRCIALSSPEGGEGNTSMAMSIARRLSAAQNSVLFLDLNRCNPLTHEDCREIVEQPPEWDFSDISCQLSTINIGLVDFLGVKQLRDSELSREKHIVKEAIIRMQQEYDYIIIDLSPVNRNNQENVPAHILVESVDLFIVTVAIGETIEADLMAAQLELEKSGFSNVKFVVAQHNMPALGPLLLQSFEKKLQRIPWLKAKLTKLVQGQDWLFQTH